MDPEMIVSVEVLDVNEEEAKKLLLSLDPLATLAGTTATRSKPWRLRCAPTTRS
jgi:hypothetical protein